MDLAHSRPWRITALMLAAVFLFSACASSVVQIREPFKAKLRPGDGVKILGKNGTLYSGRITYLDDRVVILRTPKQTVTNSPVKVAKFGTSIPWETIKSIKVAGTLDSQRKLISNEEIRVNRRTNLRRKLMANVGLLGLATSFLVGSAIQEQIAPADPQNLTGNHGKARFSFWSTVLAGTAASVAGGYKLGQFLDNQKAVERIERFRAEARMNEQNKTKEVTERRVSGTPLVQ